MPWAILLCWSELQRAHWQAREETCILCHWATMARVLDASRESFYLLRACEAGPPSWGVYPGQSFCLALYSLGGGHARLAALTESSAVASVLSALCYKNWTASAWKMIKWPESPLDIMYASQVGYQWPAGVGSDQTYIWLWWRFALAVSSWCIIIMLPEYPSENVLASFDQMHLMHCYSQAPHAFHQFNPLLRWTKISPIRNCMQGY